MGSKAPNIHHFMADVRKEKGFRTLSFVYDLFEVSPPHLKRGRTIKDVEFTEPNIPHALISYTSQIATISTAPQPTQEIVNIAAEESVRDAAFPPPYRPYVTVDYTAHPRLPRIATHIASLSAWRASVRRFPNKQGISFQMWTHHHLKFIVTADLRNAWRPFGGLAAQLSQLAVLLALASTETCSFAMQYRAELSRFLADAARDRLDIDYAAYLCNRKDDIYKRTPQEYRAATGRTFAPAIAPPPDVASAQQNPNFRWRSVLIGAYLL